MKIAIMGYGTIGSGVAEVLERNKSVIAERAKEEIELKKVLDLRDFPGDPVEDKLVRDYMDIVNDPEIGVVVETMGGVEPAYTFVKAMLLAGKHVTTSNKALVADKGAELIRIARENNVNFTFEASVGGGIPIIRTLLSCLTGDVIEEISGIVNGTTNYMLTSMATRGSDFDKVLAEAQELGYAEKDPTAYVEGHDAQRKIAILTSLVAGAQIDYQDIPTEGITKISTGDMAYAKVLGRVIKLVARAKRSGDTYSIRVAPLMLPEGHPLFHVDGVFNAIMVHGNMLGDGMFYGSGAGSLPTASAVVGDIVDMVRHKDENIYLKWDEAKLTLKDPKDEEYCYFVRTHADHSAVERVFDKFRYVDADIHGECAFVTESMSEETFWSKKEQLSDIISVIRVV